MRAFTRYNRATVANDTIELDRLIANDYILVNSDASVENKAAYLADFHLPGFKITPYALKRPIYRVCNGVALIAGHLQLNWMQEGRRHRRMIRVAYLWVRQDHDWRMFYTQVTRELSITSKPAVR
jgi:hypothetical protein